MKQNQISELPKYSEANQDIAIDFAGVFQNAKGAKKYLLVSINHFTAWLEAKFPPETEHRKSHRVFEKLHRTARNSAENKNGPGNDLL